MLQAGAVGHMQHFTGSGTSTPFPSLLEEQGRTDPNSSGQLDGVTLPKALAKAEGSAALPKPEDGLLEVLVPSWA